jgi:hypothetical protein
LGGGVLDLGEFVGREIDVSGADVLFQPVQLARAGDRDDPRLWASGQARAIWPGVAPLRCAMLASRSTHTMIIFSCGRWRLMRPFATLSGAVAISDDIGQGDGDFIHGSDLS